VVYAADEQQTRKAADSTGERHSAHDDLLDLDADVARGALALADDAYLIAVFGVVEVHVHRDRHHSSDDYAQQVLVTAELRKPAKLGSLIDDADLPRALGDFPHDDEIRDELGRDIVHHQGEERLVRVPFGLEEGRDKAPQRARRDSRDGHGEDQHAV